MVWDVSLICRWVGLGSLGWTLALTLRIPLVVAMRRVTNSPSALEHLTVLSSGPLEELVRLGMLAIAGNSFTIAYSVGLGWGGIEVVYAVFTGYATAVLASGTDTQADQVRERLRELGALSPAAPLLGVLERASAAALHVGFALLLATWPVLIVALAPLHSSINLGVLATTRRNPLAAQSLLAGVSITAFLAGLSAFERI